MNWPNSKVDLLLHGVARMSKFCDLNNLDIPNVNIVDRSNWQFGVCAYYRPDTAENRKWTKTGINVCLSKCQTPCGAAESRNWTWPGSITDREPYGVIAHELAHHMDWTVSEKKGRYFGDYSVQLRAESGEGPVTGYCENDAEWFAEIGRVFITNPDLLRLCRPKTYDLMLKKWKPIEGESWQEVLGENVPDRVLRTLRKKFRVAA